ncbi:unnamed protein product, partial [Tetraodon nigroviridis]
MDTGNTGIHIQGREDGAAAAPPASKILRGDEASEAAETGGRQQRTEMAAPPGPGADLEEKLQQDEHKNLGGHTGGVTCLSAPPLEYCRKLARSLSLSDKERFILSGSADCYVKIWALSIGQCVKSIYTFNAVSALCFVPEGDGYIVTGSDGGKVQVWSWHTFEGCQSVTAHQEAVTSLQAQGPLVFSGSAEGGVSVWENQRSARDPLRLLHRWGAQATGCGGQRDGRLALSPRGDRVFLADGRAWLKILHWRTGGLRGGGGFGHGNICIIPPSNICPLSTGTVSKLANHSSITGVTDCAQQTGGLLIGSCYDLANGEHALNCERQATDAARRRPFLSVAVSPQCSLCLSVATWPLSPGPARPGSSAWQRGPRGAETTAGSPGAAAWWCGSSSRARPSR